MTLLEKLNRIIPTKERFKWSQNSCSCCTWSGFFTYLKLMDVSLIVRLRFLVYSPFALLPNILLVILCWVMTYETPFMKGKRCAMFHEDTILDFLLPVDCMSWHSIEIYQPRLQKREHGAESHVRKQLISFLLSLCAEMIAQHLSCALQQKTIPNKEGLVSRRCYF